MAKLKGKPILEADLLEYLSAYSDFSFELAVLKMLRDCELHCEHGGHYEDPVTAKSREFDIRARKTIGKYRVRMAIECKNIRENFPVLVSCIPRHEQESYHQIALVREPTESSRFSLIDLHQSRATILSIRGQHSLYLPNELVGKSTVQVGRAVDNTISTNDAELFEKWGQCLSSASDLVENAYWDGGREDEEDHYFSAVLPFVVVPNGRLWMVSYDEQGSRVSDPIAANRCSCFIDKQYEMGSGVANAHMSLSHVEIVTFDGMLSFVEEHLLTSDGMARIFSYEGIIDALDRTTNV